MNLTTQMKQKNQLATPLDDCSTNLHATLQRYFGYDTFRDHQEDIITSILSGHDTIAIMPTGAGKSLCYQLPAIISDSTTIVISPLISLMKDQVDYLESIGVKATYLNSSLTATQFRSRLHGIYENEYKIIYVAPERLETDGFMNAINSLEIPCKQVIIDEAHCVSRWGHDFRPSYTRILDFINGFEKRPTIAAFTATATETVRKDIELSLGLKHPTRFITGFDRPNLEFKVYVHVDKNQYIKEYIRERKDEIGIIYAATRKETEKIQTFLSKAGINCSVYHAGLSDKVRNQAQEDFIYDNVSVMIATNAFGMGIDKSNVRYVIHYNMPRDLESYYQEAGRAGRDGLPSQCILLYSAGDTAVQKYFIDEGAISPDRKSHEYKNLQTMESYCHTTTCLRKYMLEYFGDDTASENCSNCSVCNNEYEEKDVTLEVQMILSCINRSGQRYGRSILVDTLRGSKNKKVLGFHLDQLKTYGLMANHSKEQIDLLMNKLIAEGYLHKTEDQYPILKLTEKSIPLLKNQGKVTMQIPKKEEKHKSDDALFGKLKEVRKYLAQKEGYPPYVIFHDATLLEMSSIMPETLDELGLIKGVGENKKEKYGALFLDVIQSYIQEHGKKAKGIQDITEDVISGGNQKQIQEQKKEVLPQEPVIPSVSTLTPTPASAIISSQTEPTYMKYLTLYLQHQSLEEVATILEVTKATVENNILKAYACGEEIDINDFIQSEYELELARLILDDKWNGTLRWIKERLPEEANYLSIKAIIEKLKRKLGINIQ